MPTLTIQPDSQFWRPNPGGQAAFLDDYTHRYCALAGGWFAGKTWAGARKLAGLHLLNAFDSSGQPTFVKSAVIAPTYQLANDFDLPELRKAFEEMNLSYEFVADPRRYCFVFPDLGTRRRPSELLVRTADSPDRITGWTAGAIWGDEAARWKCDDGDPSNDPILQADARLRDPRAVFLQFILTFTHEGDGTRVYKDFELTPKPDHVLYRAGTMQNPHAAQFAEVQRQQLTPELAGQYLDGIVMSNGPQKIYTSFDYERNVDERLELSTDLPLQIAVDFNISPGMHCLIGQHIPQTTAGHDLMTSIWEIHRPNLSIREMVPAMVKVLNDLGWKWASPLQIFGDASGNARWPGGGETCYEVLREALRLAGVPLTLRVPRQNPGVQDRINTVNCALFDLAGRVRYKIHPRCQRLIEDYRAMRWGTDGHPDKRDSQRSHASDADGYRVHYQMPIVKVIRDAGTVSVMR